MPSFSGSRSRCSRYPLPAIPSNPVETLIAAVNAHSASLGFAVDHGPATRSCGMSPEYAGRVALLMLVSGRLKRSGRELYSELGTHLRNVLFN
jgi:hypothetical protein